MSTSLPRVAVVMPVRNGERFIAEAVRSVLGQSLEDLELLVIDDASTDRTATIAAGFDDPRLSILRNPQRLGVSASRNRGMAQARAAYVAFLDADDVAYPHRLEKQVTYLDAHQDVALVGAHMDYVDESGRLLYSESEGHRPCDPGKLRLELLKRACILPSTATGRRSVLLGAGGFPTMDYAEDHALWCRVALHHDLAILPDRLVAYRHHAGQATQRKLRAAHAGTQACIKLAADAYVRAGLIDPSQVPRTPGLLDRLRGGDGTFAASCVEWARLYGWALKQPHRALALAARAVAAAPLNGRAWSALVVYAWQAAMPARARQALRWYAHRLRSMVTHRGVSE